jgi:hypothetical protein
MKELLQQYAAHNIWATKLLIGTINLLPEEKLLAVFPLYTKPYNICGWQRRFGGNAIN